MEVSTLCLRQSVTEGQMADEQQHSVATLIKRLARYLKPDAHAMAAAILALFASSAANLAFPTVMGQVIDQSVASHKQGDSKKSIPVLTKALIVFSVGSVASCIRVFLLNRISSRVSSRIRRDIFKSTLARRKAFFDRTRSSQMTSVLADDVEVTSEVLTTTLASGIRAMSSSINGSILLFSLSPHLTMVSMSVLPFGALMVMRLYQTVNRRSTMLAAERAEGICFIQERFYNITTIKIFGRENHELKTYEEHLAETDQTAKSVALIEGIFRGTMFLSLNVSMIAILYTGGWLVGQGKMTAGNLTTFGLYSSLVGLGFSGMIQFFSRCSRSMSSVRRAFSLIDERKPEKTVTDIETSKNSTGRIQFNNVTFSYPTRRRASVLLGVNLEVSPGEMVALTGRTGSGKSTIAKLLIRLYDVDSGSITIDDESIYNMSVSSLRGIIGVVEQDPGLFYGSILDNVRYGRLDANDEEVYEACRIANCEEFIERLPNGYDTIVGEKGSHMSGGQKQRLAIARAILKDPRILVFDEATGALDIASERLVVEAFNRIRENRSVLVIAHRRETLMMSDKVAYLENGKIKEIGSYEELIDSGSLSTLLQEGARI